MIKYRLRFASRHVWRLCGAFVFATLAACAGSGKAPPTLEELLTAKNFQLGEPVKRVQNYRLNGWNYLDRKHVIMLSGPSDYYLVSLRTPCDGLMSAESIAFSTTTGSLTAMDKLIVRGTGRIVEQCFISSLNKLEKVKQKQKT